MPGGHLAQPVLVRPDVLLQADQAAIEGGVHGLVVVLADQRIAGEDQAHLDRVVVGAAVPGNQHMDVCDREVLDPAQQVAQVLAHLVQHRARQGALLQVELNAGLLFFIGNHGTSWVNGRNRVAH